jgi:Ran GTPase-activating protein (RanGAP) involved in mRNA processing and transport
LWLRRSCVQANGSLQTLKLARNKINDIGAWELSEALKANRTLTKLDLTRNAVEEAGATELNEALRVSERDWGEGIG